MVPARRRLPRRRLVREEPQSSADTMTFLNWECRRASVIERNQCGNLARPEEAEVALPGWLMKSSQVSCGGTPGPSHGRPLMIACATETLPAIISLKCITAVGVAMAAHGREALL
ncbi:hypothetical protein SRHO_G00025890 [Serrasalmus rhombeus]